MDNKGQKTSGEFHNEGTGKKDNGGLNNVIQIDDNFTEREVGQRRRVVMCFCKIRMLQC
jgi:hypothetical protein